MYIIDAAGGMSIETCAELARDGGAGIAGGGAPRVIPGSAGLEYGSKVAGWVNAGLSLPKLEVALQQFSSARRDKGESGGDQTHGAGFGSRRRLTVADEASCTAGSDSITRDRNQRIAYESSINVEGCCFPLIDVYRAWNVDVGELQEIRVAWHADAAVNCCYDTHSRIQRSNGWVAGHGESQRRSENERILLAGAIKIG